jgi:hypothetical protein
MDHYSYTQLSTYLHCPLKYKYHYLEGWQETEDKASLVFGKVFQSAVEAQFLVADAVQFFTARWGESRTCRSSTRTAIAGRRCSSRARRCWNSSAGTSGY